LTPDTKQIVFHLHSENKKIIVVLVNSIYHNSQFMVEGNESTWVHGKSDMLSRLLAKSKTRNDFFHHPKRWIAYIPVGVFFAIITGFVISNESLGRLITFLAWSIFYPLNFNYFFGWLYPKNETEYSRQVRLRKKILGGVSVIFLSLIGAFIWELIKGL
jgi:hypothetical protein